LLALESHKYTRLTKDFFNFIYGIKPNLAKSS
jgi:hypothetical protein